MTKYINTYKELASTHKTSVREVLRHWALNGLTAMNMLSGNHLKKPRVQFLYIHHTFADEEKKLEELLKKLQQQHTFIPYTKAVEKVINGEIDKPYIAFSSDDGFKNNLNAAEILSRYNAQACFFINPGLIGVTDYNFIKQHCAEKLHFPPVEFLNWDEVNTIQKMGHEIGSHTMFHMDIGKASTEEINEDMQQCYKIITEKCGLVEHFAFPYGRFSNFTEEARKAVYASGFTSCASAERGCHFPHQQKLSREEVCIRRDHIILDWKLSHIMYFMQAAAKSGNYNNNFFPYTQ